MVKRFREVLQHQPMLLPPDISDLIEPDAMVRVIDHVVDQIDLTWIDNAYPGGGRPAHNPVMLLKVLLYAYSSGVYSSRKIAVLTTKDLHAMWLCGMQPISHNTINRFRKNRLGSEFEKIYAQIIALLADSGFVDLNTYFLDGTKIEAVSGRYTFTWAKASAKYKANLQEKIHQQLQLIDELNLAEDQLCPQTPAEIDSTRVDTAIETINQIIQQDPDLKAKTQVTRGRPPKTTSTHCDTPTGSVGADTHTAHAHPAHQTGTGNPPRTNSGPGRHVQHPGSTLSEDQKKLVVDTFRQARTDWAPRLAKYEQDEAILAGRSSYSKTDVDATFMRLKDDHMRNGQLKPAYNIQAGCNNQFIIDVTVHQRPGDTACTIAHLDHVEQMYGQYPRTVVADAGYGSLQNYEWFDRKDICAVVKHNVTDRQKKRTWSKDPFNTSLWPYDSILDRYICPGGSQLMLEGVSKSTSDLGYTTVVRRYRTDECEGCPLRVRCLKNPENTHRTLQVNPELVRHRQRADFVLATQLGDALIRRRGVEIETVFGSIKRNMGFNRFTLRGLAGVTLEMRLVAMGHNLAKLTRLLQRGALS